MSKIDKLLHDLNEFIQKAEEEQGDSLEDLIPDYPDIKKVAEFSEEYEKTVAKLLRKQRKMFIDEFQSYISKNDKITLEVILMYFRKDLFAKDEFAKEFGEETAKYLEMTIKELSSLMMESIDKDVLFEVLSQRTINWINEWSRALAELMELGTHKAIERELIHAIDNGLSIQEAELRIKDLPQFDRARARATARTEILTASSRAHYESFMQSPAVTKKKWKHSGTKKIDARENHIMMDGVEVGVDELFILPESNEFCMYPRDPMLSAKERVNCGCVIGPVVDENILRLSKEEKEAIRQQVLDEMSF